MARDRCRPETRLERDRPGQQRCRTPRRHHRHGRHRPAAAQREQSSTMAPPKDIRAWVRGHGYGVPDRGRIPADILSKGTPGGLRDRTTRLHGPTGPVPSNVLGFAARGQLLRQYVPGAVPCMRLNA
ncbi:histone-like nucleoid-structuring protein Lsr2 [Streptomyces litmocidini]